MIPYTYCVFNKVTKQRYYGVRFAKNSNPQELWKTYFTSSKYVHKLIKQYGIDSFDYRVRKTFINKQSAILWENKVLRRLNVLNKPTWLNRSTNKAIILSADKQIETYKKISKSLRGKKKTESHINNLKFSIANRTSEQKERTRALKVNASTGRKQKSSSIEKRMQSIRSTVWINNGIKNLRIQPAELPLFPLWNLGRISFSRNYDNISPVYNITNLKTGDKFTKSRIEFCRAFNFNTSNIPSDKGGTVTITYKGFLLSRFSTQGILGDK